MVNVLDKVVEQWLGYNFVIYSTRDPVLISAGVSEIVFPEAAIQYIPQKGLSTKTQQIPVGVSYSDLVLTAPVERGNTILSFKLNKMIGYLGGRTSLAEVGINKLLGDTRQVDPLVAQYENFVIVGFNGGAATGKTPIGVWNCGNCLLANYSVDSADSNNAKVMTETARYKVGNFKRYI